MLLRNMLDSFLYEVDSTSGAEAPTPETEQGKLSGATTGDAEKKKPTEIVLSSGQLKKRLEEAKAIAKRELLESLGQSDETALKSLVESHKAKTEADKSESQKLAERLAQLEKQLQEKDSKLAEAEKTRRLAIRDSELKAMLTKAIDATEVLVFLKNAIPEKLDALLDEDGNFDTDAATKLVSEYQTLKPHWFKDTSHGSSLSTRDGKAPEINADAKKAISNMTAKSLRGF